MIVRTLDSIQGTSRIVVDPHGQWVSQRLLLQQDKMGFTFNVTEIKAGANAQMEYKNHLEACYCIKGTGEIIDSKGKKYSIQPGTIYALDLHDRHTLCAFTDMTLISVFNPPLRGDEVHLADGSYPLHHENT